LELWLAGWLLVQVSEFFPFFIFQNKLVVEFQFLSTKELRISLCGLGRFLVSLERFFFFLNLTWKFSTNDPKKFTGLEVFFKSLNLIPSGKKQVVY
jgi:hypothetical protein